VWVSTSNGELCVFCGGRPGADELERARPGLVKTRTVCLLCRAQPARGTLRTRFDAVLALPAASSTAVASVVRAITNCLRAATEKTAPGEAAVLEHYSKICCYVDEIVQEVRVPLTAAQAAGRRGGGAALGRRSSSPREHHAFQPSHARPYAGRCRSAGL
jgi:hypothetical protein